MSISLKDKVSTIKNQQITIEESNSIKVLQRTDYAKKHYALLAIVGGFLEAFAIINRDGLFGNAQTSNYTHLWINLVNGEIGDFVYHLIPFVLYCIAITIATALPIILKKTSWPKMCIILECLSIVILGFLPSSVEYRYAILPIFFCTALQFQTFQSCCDHAASSIFVTNNIRHCVNSLTLYIFKKDKSQLKKFEIFMHIIIFFAVGVISAFVTGHLFGDRSIWACLIPLIPLYFMI